MRKKDLENTGFNPVALAQIETIQKKSDKINPLVVIRCMTYNQAAYIRDTLEGFVNQKTTFPFIAIIHDDASNDQTVEIIQEYADKYPNIIMPIFESENQYSKHDGSLRRIMNKACESTGAKYMAMCEGDDYWIDSLKLQKQIDFLETHTSYSMCYSQVKIFFQNKPQKTKLLGRTYEGYASLLCNKYMIPTATIILRSACLTNEYEQIRNSHPKWKMGDLPLSLYLAGKGKIHMIKEPLAAYRVLNNSASHFNSFIKHKQFIDSAYDVKKYFAKTMGCDKKTIKKLEETKILELSHYAVKYDELAFMQNLYRNYRGPLSIKGLVYKMSTKSPFFFNCLKKILSII